MDPLSIGAGVIGIVGLAAQISQIVFNLGLDWKDAPETVKSFIAELQTLQRVSLSMSDNLLNNSDFIAAFEGGHSLTLTEFNDQSGPTVQLLNGCKVALEKLQDELQGRILGRSFGWQRVKGALLAKNTQQAVQNLSRQLQTMNNMLAVDTATISVRTLGEVKSLKQEQQKFKSDEARASTAIKRGVDGLQLAQEREETREILDWLSPVSYIATHDDLADKRTSQTGGWLLTSDHFGDWLAGRTQTVLGTGKPGSGKTMLTSIAIDHLRTRFAAQSDVGIAYLYFNFRRKSEHKAKDLLASLLRQLMQQHETLPPFIKQFRERHRQSGTGPTISNILEMLSYILKDSYSRSYIFIDALDECGITERDRRTFMSELFKLQELTHLSLFATSRDVPDVIREFKGHVHFGIRAQEEDVRTYLASRMDGMPHIIQRSQALQDEITTAIVAAVDGMFVTSISHDAVKADTRRFLLAMLHMDSLQGSRSVKAVRTKLSKLPSGSDAYDFAYEDAMYRIQSQHSESHKLAIETLSWITFAFRPLRSEELCHALAIELGTNDLDEENVPELEDVISVCCGLVVLDEKSDVVRLAHYTTQEYFERTFTRWFPGAQSQIADMCLTYLCFDEFGSGPVDSGRDYIARCQRYPLLKYAAKNWGNHCRGTQAEVGDCIMSFFGDTVKMDNAFQIMELGNYSPPEDSILSPVRKNEAAHLAAYCGLTTSLNHLKEASMAHLNVRNTDGRSPLSYAAIEARKSCIELILAQSGSSIDGKDGMGRTPFSYAAYSGDKEIFQLFMALPDIDINSVDLRHYTPLHHAVAQGHEEIVEILLSHPDIKADTTNTEMMTPIFTAVSVGRPSIVEALLARSDVAASRLDKSGESILHHAIRSNYKDAWAIVKIILERWPSMVNLPNIDGKTPLSFAIHQGNLELIRLLATLPGAAFDSRDRNGRTPLSLAASYNNSNIVKLILERSRDQLNVTDYDGRSPLSWAADCSNIGVVKYLLTRRGIDLNSVDNDGRTAASYMLEWGSRIESELFLNRPDVALGIKDNAGRTLMHYAVNDGTGETLKLLVGISTRHIDSKDKYGRTPLSYAAASSGKDVVEFLINLPGVTADSKDNDGRTPLSYSTQFMGIRTSQLFIERDDVDANSKDDKGRTPLSYAVRNYCVKNVKLLLGCPGVEADAPDHYGRTPLSYAAHGSSQTILKLLLAIDGVKVEAPDNGGRTPLSYAAENYGHWMAETLLSLPGVQADSRDMEGRTPLTYAAYRARVKVCEMLIARAPATIDASDNSGRTPFSYAASSYSPEAVQFFLGFMDINFNSLDKNGRSPLSHAIESGGTEVCELLLNHDSIQINNRDHSGRTLMSLAAGHESFVFRRLLEMCPIAEIDLKDDKGMTPLSYAAKEDQHLCVGLLLDCPGVDINSQNNEGQTPLSHAASNQSHLCSELLISQPNIDVNQPDQYGRTPLSYAASFGPVSTLERLIGHHKIQLDIKDENEQTPLYHAAKKGNTRHAELLMAQAYVDVNSKDEYGTSVLLQAVRQQHQRIVKLLLDRPDVDVNAPDGDGDTPLFSAVRKQDTKIIKLLYDRVELDIDCKDDAGRTPLTYAIENAAPDFIKVIQNCEMSLISSRVWAETMGRSDKKRATHPTADTC